jgi:hypothetical protein
LVEVESLGIGGIQVILFFNSRLLRGLLFHRFLFKIPFFLRNQLPLNGSLEEVLQRCDIGIPLVGRKRAPDHLNKPLVVLDDYLSHLHIGNVRYVETQSVNVVRDQVAESWVLRDRLGHEDVKFFQDVLKSRLNELCLGPKC